MSNLNFAPRSALIAAAVAAEGLALAVEYRTGRRSWRIDAAPARDTRPSWDRAGVEALVDAARVDFTTRTGVRLPGNLSVHGPWVTHPGIGAIRETDADPRRPHECPLGTAAKMVGTAARAAGWLRAAADSRFLTRVLGATLSDRGINSPSTLIAPYTLFGRYTPGAAERRGRAIRARAAEILAPMGLSPSWAGVGVALAGGPKVVGKAAFIVAAVTLGHTGNPTYRAARAFLATVCRTGGSREDATDGVSAWTVGEPETLHGVTVQRVANRLHGRKGVRAARQTMFLVAGPGGRTYHAPAWWQCGPRAAVRAALEAWDRQRQVERAARARDERLGRVSVLVTFADSLSAGNCYPGTAEFQRRHGWDSRWYVPAQWLYATGDGAAVRAANHAEADVLDRMDRAA